MSLSNDQNVAQVFIVALFLGIFLVTFGIALRWLLCDDDGWKLRRKIGWIMVLFTGIIFGLTLARAVWLLRDIMVSVMKPVAQGTSSKPVETRPTVNLAGIADCILANSPILLSDAVFLYRLWLVYNKNYRIIIFPALFWLGALFSTIIRTAWDFLPGAPELTLSWPLVNLRSGPGIIMAPFWGATMVLNIYATVMMTRRIWKITKKREGTTATHSLGFLMRVFIESGCIYIIVAMSHFIAWWTPSAYALSLVATMNTPMTGIAFNLITIRTYETSAKEKLEIYSRARHTTRRTLTGIVFGDPPTTTTAATVQTQTQTCQELEQQQWDSASVIHTQRTSSFGAESTLS